MRCFPSRTLYSALPRMNLMNSLPCSTTGKVVAMPMRTVAGRGITSWVTGDAQAAPVESEFREGRLTTRAAAPTSECCSVVREPSQKIVLPFRRGRRTFSVDHVDSLSVRSDEIHVRKEKET